MNTIIRICWKELDAPKIREFVLIVVFYALFFVGFNFTGRLAMYVSAGVNLPENINIGAAYASGAIWAVLCLETALLFDITEKSLYGDENIALVFSEFSESHIQRALLLPYILAIAASLILGTGIDYLICGIINGFQASSAYGLLSSYLSWPSFKFGLYFFAPSVFLNILNRYVFFDASLKNLELK
jgi:hypothetical protein